MAFIWGFSAAHVTFMHWMPNLQLGRLFLLKLVRMEMSLRWWLTIKSFESMIMSQRRQIWSTELGSVLIHFNLKCTIYSRVAIHYLSEVRFHLNWVVYPEISKCDNFSPFMHLYVLFMDEGSDNIDLVRRHSPYF